jgi:hypothetical protein
VGKESIEYCKMVAMTCERLWRITIGIYQLFVMFTFKLKISPKIHNVQSIIFMLFAWASVMMAVSSTNCSIIIISVGMKIISLSVF